MDLTTEIKQLETTKRIRIKNLEEYNEIAENAGLPTDPSEEVFLSNREQANQLQQSTQQKVEEGNANLLALENKDKEIKNTNDSLNKYIPVSNCLRCGRDLEDTTSVNRGYGPICWAKKNRYY